MNLNHRIDSVVCRFSPPRGGRRKEGVKARVLLFWILASLTAAILYPRSLPAQDKALYVLYSGINANYLSLWLAKDAHYFADEGLNVQAVHDVFSTIEIGI